MSDQFEFVEYTGKGKVWTFTRIATAPTGFDNDVPYTCVVVELEGGGRLLAWSGETLPQDKVKIDINSELQVFISDTGRRGDGIAKVEGYTIYVNGGVKGSNIKIRVENVRGRIAFARKI